MQSWSAWKIIDFGWVGCLFTFSCLFTSAPNSAMIWDRAHLIQVGQHEIYHFWWGQLFVYFQPLVNIWLDCPFECPLVAYLCRLARECPLVANFGSLGQECPLVANLCRLARECPLVADMCRLVWECHLVANFGRLAQESPLEAYLCKLAGESHLMARSWPICADWFRSTPWLWLIWAYLPMTGDLHPSTVHRRMTFSNWSDRWLR